MNDKDWLERVSIAFKVYEEYGGPQPIVSEFIKWLYAQYGIVQSTNKN